MVKEQSVCNNVDNEMVQENLLPKEAKIQHPCKGVEIISERTKE